MKLLKLGILPLICFMIILTPLWAGTFSTRETKTIGGDSFTFPQDALRSGISLFAIALGTTRESGEIQQEHLLTWQSQLKNANSPLRSIPLYHFPVIDAPRFIQGVIRRGIAKSYEGIVSFDNAAVLFIKNTEEFSSESGIPIDNQATVALVHPNGSVIGFVKGPPTPQSITTLEQLYSEFSRK